MTKKWKWILGILIAVIVVAALITVPLVMRSYMLTNNYGNAQLQNQPGSPWQHPMMQGQNGKQGDFGGRGMEGGRMFNSGRQFNRGFRSFGLGLMFFGGLLRLIPLALFGLLLYGVYQLGKRSALKAAAIPVAAVVTGPLPSEVKSDETPSI